MDSEGNEKTPQEKNPGSSKRQRIAKPQIIPERKTDNQPKPGPRG